MNGDELDATLEYEPILEEGTPVISELREGPTADPKSIEDSPMYEDFENETEERIRIENMSPEETMAYLAQSLSEINSFSDFGDLFLPEISEEAEEAPEPAVLSTQTFEEEDKDDRDPNALTVEPVWGDIYIKASRNLRELCEQGKLSMARIETELKEKLLVSAEQFSAVTKDGSRVPKVLIPKITELKSAVSNIEPYFQLGEDVATRAMFFMLYQMLSYADRIAETPETKENLNDFFRRFGPAGIMLSMLDVRV